MRRWSALLRMTAKPSEGLHHGLASMSPPRMLEGGRSLRLAPLLAPRSGSAAHLLSEVERLLLDVVPDGFVASTSLPSGASTGSPRPPTPTPPVRIEEIDPGWNAAATVRYRAASST